MHIVTELHALLTVTTAAAEEGLPGKVHKMLCSWRVVGDPKCGSDDNRPIVISPCIVRAWQRALLAHLPGEPDGQWCCKRGCGVFRPPVGWLAWSWIWRRPPPRSTRASLLQP